MGQDKREVAVVGMAMRLPGGCFDEASLWKNLMEGFDASTDIPEDRWSSGKFFDEDRRRIAKSRIKKGNFVVGDEYSTFDYSFFNISKKEAEMIDPQHRMLLQLTYESFEDAGICPSEYSGKSVSVVTGIMTTEYLNVVKLDPTINAGYTVLGNARTMSANRISWYFNFKGRSLNIDTACSSSLVAVDMGITDLLNGRSELAVAAGSSFMINPEVNIGFDKLGLLSLDGRSKPFDAGADGYGRGEGVGVVLLKRLDDAVRDKNFIYCKIVGSESNHDGYTPVVAFPSSEAQEELIRKTYSRNGLVPADTGYVECHGTGTMGDIEEVGAVRNAIPPQDMEEDRLLISSVKGNIGHLEGAAGVAGLIKAVLCLRHGIIPPNPQLKDPHEDLKLKAKGMFCPMGGRAEEWLANQNGVRQASLNSFGIGGSNAHCVLQNYESDSECDLSEPSAPKHEGKLVLALSGHNKESLLANSKNWEEYLQSFLGEEDQNSALDALKDALHEQITCRDHQKSRLVVIGDNIMDLKYGLAREVDAICGTKEEKSTENNSTNSISVHKFFTQSRAEEFGTPVYCIFGGQGSQYKNMGVHLYEQEAVFRDCFDKCEAIMHELVVATCESDADATFHGFVSMIEECRKGERLFETWLSQPLVAAWEMALYEYWRDLGLDHSIKAVVGHSSGEIAAAYACGYLTLREAMTVAFYRGFYVSKVAGKMIYMSVSREKAEEFLAGSVRLAAVNSHAAVSVSGEKQDVLLLAEQLREKEVDFYWKLLDIETPFHHSELLLDACKMYHEQLLKVFPKSISSELNCSVEAPKLFFSSIIGEIASQETVRKADYWSRNALYPVDFEAAISNMLRFAKVREKNSEAIVLLDASPHPILGVAVRETAAELFKDGGKFVHVHSMSRGMPQTKLFEAVAELFVNNVQLEIERLLPAGAGVSKNMRMRGRPIPKYAFSSGPATLLDGRGIFSKLELLGPAFHNFLGRRSPSISPDQYMWQNFLDLYTDKAISKHCILGSAVFPSSAYLEVAIAAMNDNAIVVRNTANVMLEEAQQRMLEDVKSGVAEESDGSAAAAAAAGEGDSEKGESKGGFFMRISDASFILPLPLTTATTQVQTMYDTTTGTITFGSGSLDNVKISDGGDDSAAEISGEHSQQISVDVSQHFRCYACKLPMAEDANLLFGGKTFRRSSLLGLCNEEINIDAFYAKLNRIGFNFGGPFKSLSALKVGMSNSTFKSLRVAYGDIATLDKEMCGNYPKKYHVHPVILDAAFQTLFALGFQMMASIFVPSSIERLDVFCETIDTDDDYWAFSVLKSAGNRSLIADIYLLKGEEGKIVAYCQNFEGRSLGATVKSSDEIFPIDYCLYKLGEKPLAATDSSTNEKESGTVSTNEKRYFVCEGRSADFFGISGDSAGKDVLLDVSAGLDLDEADIAVFTDRVIKSSVEGEEDASLMITYTCNSNEEEVDPIDMTRCFAVFRTILKKSGELGGKNKSLKVVFLIESTAAASGMLGFFRVLANEAPQFRPQYIGLSHLHGSNGRKVLGMVEKVKLAEELREEPEIYYNCGTGDFSTLDIEPIAFPAPEEENALDDPKTESSGPKDTKKFENYVLFQEKIGNLSTFKWMESPRPVRGKLEPMHALVRVDYVGMNFKDIMIAIGLLSADDFGVDGWTRNILGTEFCGVIEDIGEIPADITYDEDEELDERNSKSAGITNLIEIMENEDALNEEFDKKFNAAATAKLVNSLSEVIADIVNDEISTEMGEIYSKLGKRRGQKRKKKAADIQERISTAVSARIKDRIGSKIGEKMDAVGNVGVGDFEKELAKELEKELEKKRQGSQGKAETAEGEPISAEPAEPVKRVEDPEDPEDHSDAEDEIVQKVSEIIKNIKKNGSEAPQTGVNTVSLPQRFHVSDHVFGFVPKLTSGFQKYMIVPLEHIRRKPDDIDPATAAGLTVAGFTAILAVLVFGRLQDGETILIHSAAGAVGLLCVQLAKEFCPNSRIICTAGSASKRELLGGMVGPENVLDSHSLSFVDGVRRITNMMGPDVIVNSLHGELTQQTIRLLAPFGRFIEIGKRDAVEGRTLEMRAFSENKMYLAFDLDRLNSYVNGASTHGGSAERIDKMRKLLGAKMKTLLALFGAETGGKLSRSGLPLHLPIKIVEAAAVDTAFKEMAAGQHTGKIVIRLPPINSIPDIDAMNIVSELNENPYLKRSLDAKKLYVVVGGASGVGLMLAEWMVLLKGAKHVAILSRSGCSPSNGALINALRRMQYVGANVHAFSVDVCDYSQLAGFLESVANGTLVHRTIRKYDPTADYEFNDLESPFLDDEEQPCQYPNVIGGMINTAMVLDDSKIEEMSSQSFAKVYETKAKGSYNVYKAVSDEIRSKDAIEFVIFLSSVSSLIGNMAQSNYSAGNQYINDLCKHWRAVSPLNVTSLCFGAIADVGVVAREQKKHAILTRYMVTPYQVIGEVQKAMEGDDADGVAVCAAVPWSQMKSMYPYIEKSAIFANVKEINLEKEIANKKGGSGGTANENEEKGREIYQKVLECGDKGEQIRMLTYEIRSKISEVTGNPLEEISENGKLVSFGIDSLQLMEMKGWVDVSFPSDVSFIQLSRSATVKDLAETILESIEEAEDRRSEIGRDLTMEEMIALYEEEKKEKEGEKELKLQKKPRGLSKGHFCEVQYESPEIPAAVFFFFPGFWTEFSAHKNLICDCLDGNYQLVGVASIADVYEINKDEHDTTKVDGFVWKEHIQEVSRQVKAHMAELRQKYCIDIPYHFVGHSVGCATALDAFNVILGDDGGEEVPGERVYTCEAFEDFIKGARENERIQKDKHLLPTSVVLLDWKEPDEADEDKEYYFRKYDELPQNMKPWKLTPERLNSFSGTQLALASRTMDPEVKRDITNLELRMESHSSVLTSPHHTTQSRMGRKHLLCDADCARTDVGTQSEKIWITKDIAERKSLERVISCCLESTVASPVDERLRSFGTHLLKIDMPIIANTGRLFREAEYKREFVGEVIVEMMRNADRLSIYHFDTGLSSLYHKLGLSALEHVTWHSIEMTDAWSELPCPLNFRRSTLDLAKQRSAATREEFIGKCFDMLNGATEDGQRKLVVFDGLLSGGEADDAVDAIIQDLVRCAPPDVDAIIFDTMIPEAQVYRVPRTAEGYGVEYKAFRGVEGRYMLAMRNSIWTSDETGHRKGSAST